LSIGQHRSREVDAPPEHSGQRGLEHGFVADTLGDVATSARVDARQHRIPVVFAGEHHDAAIEIMALDEIEDIQA
jgi:hypothetical protein